MTPSPVPRRRPGRLAGLLVAVAVLVGGCTVSTNAEPQEIAVEDVPSVLLETTTTSTTTTSPTATKTEQLWFLDSDDTATVLVPVERQFEVDASLQQILDNLVTAPEPDLVSRLNPESVQIVQVLVDPATGTATINVRGLFGSVQDPLLSQALAQLVYTATGEEGVTQVRFLNDGVAVENIGAESTTVVDREDFRQFRG